MIYLPITSWCGVPSDGAENRETFYILSVIETRLGEAETQVDQKQRQKRQKAKEFQAGSVRNNCNIKMQVWRPEGTVGILILSMAEIHAFEQD